MEIKGRFVDYGEEVHWVVKKVRLFVGQCLVWWIRW